MLRQVADGCFAVAEEMQFAPDKIHITKWGFPRRVTDHDESEEFLARLIWFSQHFNEWVGVSLGCFGLMIEGELDMLDQIKDTQKRNRAAESNHLSACRRNTFTRRALLGLYRPSNPVLELETLPSVAMPRTGIYVHGMAYVARGIRYLLERGFLRREKLGTDDVIFPTLRLVLWVNEMQDLSGSLNGQVAFRTSLELLTIAS